MYNHIIDVLVKVYMTRIFKIYVGFWRTLHLFAPKFSMAHYKHIASVFAIPRLQKSSFFRNIHIKPKSASREQDMQVKK